MPRESLPDPTALFNHDDPIHLNYIECDVDDFISAIDELTINASAGPDEFPAILLKQLKTILAEPLCLIWRHSLNDGMCPSKAKESVILPIHKG